MGHSITARMIGLKREGTRVGLMWLYACGCMRAAAGNQRSARKPSP